MNQKKDNEITAMQAVQDALEPLDDAARVRVVNWAIQRLSISVPQLSPAVGGGKNPPGSGSPNLPSGVSIKDFVAAKRPQSVYQRLACFAYYLEKYEDKPEFKAKELTDANQRARQPKIANITVYVNHTTRTYGFLASTTKGKKSLTPRGEAVVEALPNHEAVERALQEHPFGKRTPKTKKKK